MGYRIDPAEPTDVELRRVVSEQLGTAAEALRVEGGPDGEAVHDVRKRLKKARSALRLGRADLGAAVARHANGELRQVGADLARQRDADALVEAVEALAAPAPEPLDAEATEALDVVRGLLAERAGAVAEAGIDRATAIGAARTLEQVAGWVQRVPPRATGWDALGPGLAREYHRGRRALRRLPHEPTVDDLHEWRKRVKDLWYHERLLRRLWTDGQRPVVDAADRLASSLGDDHDLGLLLGHVAPAAGHLRSTAERVEPLVLDADVRRLVGELARSRRGRIQAGARALGARLYADEPEAWAARHGAWWEAARAVDDPSPDRATA